MEFHLHRLDLPRGALRPLTATVLFFLVQYLTNMSCNLMAQKKFQIDLNSLSTLRPLTISFASWILETCPDILHDQERSSLLEAVKATINDSILINPPLVSSELKQDKRSFDDVFIPGTLSQLKVYTDYEFFKNLINKLDFQFQIVDAREEADFLFLAHNIRDFYSISQRVNSFPYEGGFVCKV